MFCPKCGTKNPDDGKFCRKCGTDLEIVADAITGNLKISDKMSAKRQKKKEVGWDSAISTLFTGLAFFAVTIILALSGAGRGWWFWMLIPAFAILGTGIAKIIQIKQDEQEKASMNPANRMSELSSREREALPPQQTEYVSPHEQGGYRTGDLAPPSVIEKTTRHLEMDKEGETMTLPKDKP
jgi:hypothetical protein